MDGNVPFSCFAGALLIRGQTPQGHDAPKSTFSLQMGHGGSYQLEPKVFSNICLFFVVNINEIGRYAFPILQLRFSFYLRNFSYCFQRSFPRTQKMLYFLFHVTPEISLISQSHIN